MTLVFLSSIGDNRKMRRRKRKTNMSDQIRAAIEASGITRYRIWKETGIDEATLSRFMSGKAGLSMKALDALADYLDLEVVMRKKRR